MHYNTVNVDLSLVTTYMIADTSCVAQIFADEIIPTSKLISFVESTMEIC